MIILVTAYASGTPQPLLWTSVGVGVLAVLRLASLLRGDGARLSVVLLRVAVVFIVIVGFPAGLFLHGAVGLALMFSLMSSLSAVGALAWKVNEERRISDPDRRKPEYDRPFSDRSDNEAIQSPPGRVSVPAQCLGVAVPTAAVVGAISSAGLTSATLLELGLFGALGGVITIAILIYLLQHLVLLWLSSPPVSLAELERIAAEARHVAASGGERSELFRPGERDRRTDLLDRVRFVIEDGADQPLGEGMRTSAGAARMEILRWLDGLGKELESGDARLVEVVQEPRGRSEAEADYRIQHLCLRLEDTFARLKYALERLQDALGRRLRVDSGWLEVALDGLYRNELDRFDRVRDDIERSRRSASGTDQLVQHTLVLQSGVIARIARPLASLRAIRACTAAAADLGLVLDVVWPRIQLVLPLDQRREIARRERVLGAYRLTAASTLCTSVVMALVAGLAGAAGLLLLSAGAAGVAVVAILAGRRELAVSYERRLSVTGVRRFDLVQALRIKQPDTTLDLVRMAGLLSDGEPRLGRPICDERVKQGEHGAGIPAEQMVNLSHELRDELVERLPERLITQLSAELRRQIERLPRPPARVDIGAQALSALAQQIAERVTSPLSSALSGQMGQMERSLGDKMREVVESAVVGEPLSPFVGFLAIELESSTGGGGRAANGRISVLAGSDLALVLSIRDDPRGRNAAPERGSQDGPFVAQQPIHIPGDGPPGTVDFELVVDSPSLTPVPQRVDVRVQPGNGAHQKISFEVPDVPGEHEAWIQLYQLGRLVEVVALPIEVRVDSSPVSAG